MRISHRTARLAFDLAGTPTSGLIVQLLWMSATDKQMKYSRPRTVNSD